MQHLRQDKLRSVKKETKLNQGFCLIKTSEIIFIFLTEFYLILWLMTSLKNFEKILILKTWQLFFFWGIKTCFGILPLKWCFLRHEKINILTKICQSFWSNEDLDTLSTSKWLFESQFCERYLGSWQKMTRNDRKMTSFETWIFRFYLPKLKNSVVKNILWFMS
jgi:hypothetical protein